MAKGRGGKCASEQEQRIPKKECSPGETGHDCQEGNLSLESGGVNWRPEGRVEF